LTWRTATRSSRATSRTSTSTMLCKRPVSSRTVSLVEMWLPLLYGCDLW
jgi:hypothetical protein